MDGRPENTLPSFLHSFPAFKQQPGRVSYTRHCDKATMAQFLTLSLTTPVTVALRSVIVLREM